MTKRYGGIVANGDIDFTVTQGELRGIIGPNGAGKSHLLQDAHLRGAPDLGQDRLRRRDITGLDVTDVCQLGLTKSYQVNQLFTRLTVRENLTSRRWPSGAARSASTCCAASTTLPG